MQFIIATCSFCGMHNVKCHKKYTDRCEECGKRYTKYANYKSMQKSSPTTKRAKLLEGIIQDYKILKQAGYKVPRDIK